MWNFGPVILSLCSLLTVVTGSPLRLQEADELDSGLHLDSSRSSVRDPLDDVITKLNSPIEGNLLSTKEVFVVREAKDLPEFFSLLQEMEKDTSVKVVGRDSKYLYLMAVDEDETGVSTQRAKRSIAGKFFDVIGPKKVRALAVPISLFNFLGYLPMRVPGVPYHIDPGSPDHTVYNPYNEFHYYDRRR